jgi:hypothetical protein
VPVDGVEGVDGGAGVAAFFEVTADPAWPLLAGGGAVQARVVAPAMTRAIPRMK